MEMWMLVMVTAVALVSVPACIFFILFYLFPHSLIRLSFCIRRYLAGMKVKYATGENYVFCYGESQAAPRPGQTTLVFIHGFSASKDQWITTFKGLPKDLHMLAVDLPGHGGSSLPEEHIQLGPDCTMRALVEFLDLLGLKHRKIHLVGSSMGGAVAGLFAATYPERVDKLTMICPAMLTPVDSEFSVQLKAAVAMGVENMSIRDCQLLPTDVPGMRAMLEVCCYSRQLLQSSDQIFRGVLNLRLPKTEFYFRLFKDLMLTENVDTMERIAPKITVPTQLIWGRQDQVVHVSGAQLLSAKLANCLRVDLIDRCGHAIDIDRPGALNKSLLSFIQLDRLSDKTTETL